MKTQNGQSVVEFALLLPMFLVIVFGIIYVGFFFGDFITLSNLARSAAREASVIEERTTVNGVSHNNYDDIAASYGKIIYEAQNNYDENTPENPNKKTLITSLCLYENNTMTVKGPGEHIFNDGPEDSVEVVIPLHLNSNAFFVTALSKLKILSNRPYNIIYYMYDETYQKSGS